MTSLSDRSRGGGTGSADVLGHACVQDGDCVHAGERLRVHAHHEQLLLGGGAVGRGLDRPALEL